MYLGNHPSRATLGLFVLLATGLLYWSLPVEAENPPTTLLLHIGPVAGSDACEQAPSTPEAIVTSAPANPDGSADYYVYLLGTPAYPEHGEAGLMGMMFGITYDENTPDHPGLAVHSWQRCWTPARAGFGLEFPTEDWPAPGSGNVLTWRGDYVCGFQPPFITGGYFYVTAYGPSVMAIQSNPGTGRLSVCDCVANEFVVEVDPGRAGWVSLGGAGLGTDSDGCNPVLEPCLGPDPVESSTWGKMKTRYVNRGRP